MSISNLWLVPSVIQRLTNMRSLNYRFIHSFHLTLQPSTAYQMFTNKKFVYSIIVLILVFICIQVGAQSGIQGRLRGLSGGSKAGGSGKDSLVHRNPNEDSITINYRYYDSSRINKLDSSVADFYTRYPVPYTYVDLG